MKKKRLNEIAKIFDWDIDEVSEAFEKLKKQKSIIEDWDIFFKLCLESKDPSERTIKVGNAIWDLVPGTNQEELVKLICNWLYRPDPLFEVLALFNITFYKDLDGSGKFRLERCKYDRSFNTLLIDYTSPHLTGIQNNGFIDSAGLCDSFLSNFIMGNKDSDEKIIQTILLSVVERIGFVAFNLFTLRSQSIFAGSDPSRRKFARSLAKKIMFVYSNKDDTERLYWSYFVLVEKLKELGFSSMQSYRLVAIKYEESESKTNTIKSRYNERKIKFKEIKSKNKNYNIDNIIEDFRLNFIVKKYLKEYGPKNHHG